MKEPASERLYKLLPSIYQIRDQQEGEPLRALLRIVENEMDALEDDIDGLYEDCFIETCAEWAIPYIGDLLGVHGFHPLSARAGSMRGYVANTLSYRRRKGTAAVLEQVAHDVTGWPAHVVEFFQRLSVTQNINHLQPERAKVACVRDANRIDLASGPFETASHTAEVRRVGQRGGKYNIPNVGIFLWRLDSYPLERVAARKVEDCENYYTFDPTGRDVPLFNRPQTETQIIHLSEEINVPGPLRRHSLRCELDARRKGAVSQTSYFGSQPVFSVYLKAKDEAESRLIKPEEMSICDLSNWSPTPGIDSETVRVAIDPERGRLILPEGGGKEVLVDYSYGFSGDVGAGPYDRTLFVRKTVEDWDLDWHFEVSLEKNKTLLDAVRKWNEQTPGTVGVISIMDSRTHLKTLEPETSETKTLKPEPLEITIPKGSRLMIVAANEKFAADGLRPHLLGDVAVVGESDGDDPGDLVIDGLLIEGKLTVLDRFGGLQVSHCTLVPGVGGICVEDGGSLDSLTIKQTICGKVELSGSVSKLSIAESIIDGTGDQALKAGRCKVRVDRSTVLGESTMRLLEASNSIFTGKVTVERHQAGCMRFSYVPKSSHTPRRFQCRSDRSISSEGDSSSARRYMGPIFTSRNYGEPGYAQLSILCAKEILNGADDGSEMGVFSFLEQPRREANLWAALDEYMKFGLDAGIFYVN